MIYSSFIHFDHLQAQFIAQSIGQAFQVAYMEFLKANGIEDHSFVKEMDYQEVLNSQEIFGDELAMFARKELQKEVKHWYFIFWNNISMIVDNIVFISTFTNFILMIGRCSKS